MDYVTEEWAKLLSDDLKESVVAYYEHDDNSRMCPGQKEVVKVRDKNGWKEQHDEKIGFSMYHQNPKLMCMSHTDHK